MATVHNAYYQSPWIETASRNLASALAPPDPDKQLATKRAQWEFDRMQQLAGIQDTDRENKHQIEDYRAEMLRPVLNPATGEIDQKLTNEKILKNWADAIDIGDDPSIGAALSGELNPEVAVKRMMAQVKAVDALGLSRFNYGQKGVLQDDAQEFTASENDKDRKHESEQNALRLKNYLDRAKAANKAGGKGPNEIPVPIINQIAFGLDDRIAATGRDMPLEQYFQFAERVGKIWQETGNVEEALNAQWAKSFPNSRSFKTAESEPDETGFWKNKRGNLTPKFEDGYADVLAPEAGAAPDAPAPPPAPKPKPAGTVAPPPRKRKPIESFGR